MNWDEFLASGDNLVPALRTVGPTVAGWVGLSIEEFWADLYRDFENSIELHRLPKKYVAKRVAEALVEVHRDRVPDDQMSSDLT